MKVIFTTEIKNDKKEYVQLADVEGDVLHFYENDTCLIRDKDNILYRVEMKKIKIKASTGLFK